MRIFLFELKKALFSPVILGLLAVFIGFNVFQIYTNKDLREPLTMLNSWAEKYGTEINEPFLVEMEKDYQAQLVLGNEASRKNIGKTYESINDIMLDPAFQQSSDFSVEELNLIYDAGLLESYFLASTSIDEDFKKVDVEALAEEQILIYGLSGSAAEWIRSHYDEFSARYNEVLEYGEYRHLFPSESMFGTHSLLFKTMFKSFMLEGLLLAVLVTANLMNFEFDRRTHLLTYSTKRGRGLWADKLLASLAASSILFALVMGSGLIIYFSVLPYDQFWQVPISSLFNAGRGWVMTWHPLSFIEYTAAAAVLACLLIVIFVILTAVLARWVTNSYLVFFLFLCLFGVMFIAPGMLARDHFLFLFGQFTPVNQLLNSFSWFMMRPMSITAFDEWLTAAIWIVVVILAVAISFRSFRRSDLT